MCFSTLTDWTTGISDKAYGDCGRSKAANMAKTDFLRWISHDIRTPINGIRGMLEIAEHFPDDTEKLKYCQIDTIEKKN